MMSPLCRRRDRPEAHTQQSNRAVTFIRPVIRSVVAREGSHPLERTDAPWITGEGVGRLYLQAHVVEGAGSAMAYSPTRAARRGLYHGGVTLRLHVISDHALEGSLSTAEPTTMHVPWRRRLLDGR